jgi:hypothetical protein
MTYHHSKATIEKIRKSRIGKHHDQATIEKIRASMLQRSALVKAGVIKPYHHSEATKRKMRLAARHRKPSKQALLASANSRLDKKLAKRIRKGMFSR